MVFSWSTDCTVEGRKEELQDDGTKTKEEGRQFSSSPTNPIAGKISALIFETRIAQGLHPAGALLCFHLLRQQKLWSFKGVDSSGCRKAHFANLPRHLFSSACLHT